ncbi:hypothetical protein VE03_04745 [Pseudogymnoascus sp. 23342-1-I1]|nr:hypothetical protein VE03_04745 [Pseudogymnoascus sp. 23342-1-I1]
MYSRDETVNYILRFYQTVIRHPYLNNATLIIPPVIGWNSIEIEGKNEAVLDLLCHLPYLRPENASEEIIIHSETITICYFDNQDRLLFYPLPAHCIYLARAKSYLGTYLILDTNEGTITEFCQTGSHITIPYEDYGALPKAEMESPPYNTYHGIVRQLDKEIREISVDIKLIRHGQLELWQVQDDKSDDDDEKEDELDREQFKAMKRERKHVADVYNTYLRHGWLDHFDKEGCKAELLKLEKRKDADEMQQMAEANPDAALFD